MHYVPMTRDEIISLLELAQATDNRNIDDAMVAVWLDAAHIARWTTAEAVDAMRHHYALETEWVRQGHITKWIKNRRRQPAPATPAAALPAPTSTAAHRARMLREMAEAIGQKKALTAGPA